MKISRLAAISLLVLSSFAATGVAPTKTELETMYDKAFRAFDANRYDEALKALDAIDARQPDLAESQNLRGVVLMRKGEYDQSEAALRKALDIDPKFWNASFNLAEIPFLKKDWSEARNRFEALVAGKSEEMRPETKLLIQYKILLTFVLQGKENMVDWIMNKFEGEKESPALYYANAALALHHNNQKEAKDWMDAAAKRYPDSLNKLFAESFYEIGWLEKPAGESRAAVEITSTAERADRMRADAQANFERAERAFQQRDFPATLKFLDLADEGAPNQAASYNLRGEVFMEQKKFDDAEEQFRKAFTADPKFREAQYNLAQIPFKKKDYAKSRERLEALFGETPGGDKNQAAQLIKYKIYMTLLLEGNDSQAQQMMDQFKFTGDTPALYYAQAAWAFKHGNPEQGNDWVSSARKIYSPALNIVFADTFYDLGWLQHAAGETAPASSTALAQANASPPAEAAPEMRFGQAGNLPAPVPAGSQAAKAPAAAVATTPVPVTAGTPAAIATTTPPVVAATTPAAVAATTPAPFAAAKPAATPATANATAGTAPAAASSIPPVASKVAAPVAASSPVAVHAPSPAPDLTAAKAPVTSAAKAPATSAAKKTPAIANASSAVTPAATALAPARIREWSQPTFAELTDRISEPRTLLVGGLLVAGVALLGWLFWQQIRRHPVAPSLYETALPLGQPRFAGAGPLTTDERRLTSDLLHGGPPKISLKLKGSEPAVRAAVLPSGVIGTRPVITEANPPSIQSPNEPDEFVSEVKMIPGAAESETAESAAETETSALPEALPNESEGQIIAETEPLRDQEEVSIAAAPEIQLSAPEPNAVEASATEAITEEPAAANLLIEEPTAIPASIEEKEAIEEKDSAEENEATIPELDEIAAVSEPTPSLEEPIPAFEEPVGQGQPIPQLTSSFSASEPVLSEWSEPETKPEAAPVEIEPETAAIAAIIGSDIAPQSPVETPSFASKIITTKPTTPPSTTPVIMPEPTPITAINEPRPAAASIPSGAPSAPNAPTSAAMQTAVQLTFSLEIASLQLTPTFKMGSLQVKPISRIVAMRLAPSAQPQPAMNLQVTFELSSVQLGAGASLGTVRLTPSSAQRPTPITSPSFEIAGLQLVSSSAAAPVQLTPAHQSQASVLMTASFQIATVEFSPSFEIASVVLHSTSKNVAVQLPGAGPSSIEAAPVFEMGNVQLGGNSEIGMIQLNPIGSGSGRRG